MVKKKECIVCKKKVYLFHSINNFPVQTINNKKIFSNFIVKNLKLYFCENCKNISLYPNVKNSILYSNFIKKNFKFKSNIKLTENFIKKKKLKKNYRILEISKHQILDKNTLKKKNIRLSNLNILKPIKGLEKIKNNSLNYVYCYDFIGNINNLKYFFKILKKKVADKGIIYFHHHYGPSIIKNLNLDRIYFEHKNLMSATMLHCLISDAKLNILSFKLRENKNFFEILISKNYYKDKNLQIMRKFINQEKKFTSLNISKFNKRIRVINENIKNFFKNKKKYTVLGFGASIGALPIMYKLNLTNKIKFIFDDNPISKKYYIKKNFYIDILNTKNMNIADIKNKIIIILAPRYFTILRRKLLSKISKKDFIVNLIPNFTCYTKKIMRF